jgi:hypothetical protein
MMHIYVHDKKKPIAVTVRRHLGEIQFRFDDGFERDVCVILDLERFCECVKIAEFVSPPTLKRRLIAFWKKWVV